MRPGPGTVRVPDARAAIDGRGQRRGHARAVGANDVDLDAGFDDGAERARLIRTGRPRTAQNDAGPEPGVARGGGHDLHARKVDSFTGYDSSWIVVREMIAKDRCPPGVEIVTGGQRSFAIISLTTIHDES